MIPSDKTRLDALKWLADRATPGPWIKIFTRIFQETPYSHGKKVQTVCGCGPIHHEDKDLQKALNDMDFIAESRTAIPWLLDLVERRTKQLDLAKETLSEYRKISSQGGRLCENSLAKQILVVLNEMEKK